VKPAPDVDTIILILAVLHGKRFYGILKGTLVHPQIRIVRGNPHSINGIGSFNLATRNPTPCTQVKHWNKIPTSPLTRDQGKLERLADFVIAILSQSFISKLIHTNRGREANGQCSSSFLLQNYKHTTTDHTDLTTI
jgi:hypothetical protein